MTKVAASKERVKAMVPSEVQGPDHIQSTFTLYILLQYVKIHMLFELLYSIIKSFLTNWTYNDHLGFIMRKPVLGLTFRPLILIIINKLKYDKFLLQHV